MKIRLNQRCHTTKEGDSHVVEVDIDDGTENPCKWEFGKYMTMRDARDFMLSAVKFSDEAVLAVTTASNKDVVQKFKERLQNFKFDESDKVHTFCCLPFRKVARKIMVLKLQKRNGSEPWEDVKNWKDLSNKNLWDEVSSHKTSPSQVRLLVSSVENKGDNMEDVAKSRKGSLEAASDDVKKTMQKLVNHGHCITGSHAHKMSEECRNSDQGCNLACGPSTLFEKQAQKTKEVIVSHVFKVKESAPVVRRNRKQSWLDSKTGKELETELITDKFLKEHSKVQDRGAQEILNNIKLTEGEHMLFHGTNSINFDKILSNGRNLMPANVPQDAAAAKRGCSMFGRGIYLTPVYNKTKAYSKVANGDEVAHVIKKFLSSKDAVTLQKKLQAKKEYKIVFVVAASLDKMTVDKSKSSNPYWAADPATEYTSPDAASAYCGGCNETYTTKELTDSIKGTTVTPLQTPNTLPDEIVVRDVRRQRIAYVLITEDNEEDLPGSPGVTLTVDHVTKMQ